MFRRNITRNADNTKIAGVCGAIADLFGINATIIRVIYLAFTVFSVVIPGVFLYLFLMLLIPREETPEPINEEPINPIN